MRILIAFTLPTALVGLFCKSGVMYRCVTLGPQLCVTLGPQLYPGGVCRVHMLWYLLLSLDLPMGGGTEGQCLAVDFDH